MSAHDNAIFQPLLKRLSKLSPLDEADRRAMTSLPTTIEVVSRNAYLVREGAVTKRCCLLLRGYACRHKTTGDGGRQIVSFHLPGDLLDLQQLLLPRADHNVQAISMATIAWIPSAELQRLLRARPNVAGALWRDSLVEASIFREWVLNVGRRDAKSRIAHLLCEFAARQDAAGLGGPERFELPMSQEDIADATGFTPVHVNRMLQALVTDGVIVRDVRKIEIADLDRMRRIADFDPAYLHEAA
ncbi:Crp/Fnr family transcriptional regulator [Sphingosinicella rhizophila]|uniref:Crp/Fnr family transcriptional regulator n=1 Tax=Sphingosinicella rhizophila TaxID=3050082 RepID=A0ABU3Q7J7_9SPHN|nr:Crp/Fnr family transcriptional regulator [Sphingosinicella sp. GR2756]MDT9599375.1 Crp/Fnr family transcriptional regulator [Sphingosinicella sp. GR2756]